MMRTAFSLLSLVIFIGVATSADQAAAGKAVKAQMVKGTIKTVDPAKNLLIVKQQLKGETVDRELSILDTTEFEITIGDVKKEVVGKGCLELLVGKEGASIQVKCDKDVNVLKVIVKAAK